MEYKELIVKIKKVSVGLEEDGAKKCASVLLDAATAITDLLARAEAAETRVHELETSYRLEKCENGPECVELGRVRKALAEAEAQAEKVERERDAAIQDMRGICYLCANAKPYSNLSRTMMSCEYKQVLASIKSPGCEHFKWRGEKEE